MTGKPIEPMPDTIDPRAPAEAPAIACPPEGPAKCEPEYICPPDSGDMPDNAPPECPARDGD